MKSNLKWLLLIPVFAIAIALGYLIPTQLLGGDEGDQSSTNNQQSQATKTEIADLQQRISGYQNLLQRDPNDGEAIKGIADSYLEIGSAQGGAGSVNDSYRSYKNAIDEYRKYLTIKPDDVEARIDLGLAYSYLEMIDVSLRELRAVVAVAPNNQRAWHSLGWVFYNGMGDVTAATDAWQKAYILDPGTAIGQEAKSFLDQFSNQQIAVPQSVSP